MCNLTVGDFSPAEFRIPKFLENEIAEALRRGETNYPPSNGVAPLRESVRRFYERGLGLDYPGELGARHVPVRARASTARSARSSIPAIASCSRCRRGTTTTTVT